VQLRVSPTRSLHSLTAIVPTITQPPGSTSGGGGGPGVTHEGLTLHEPGLFHKGWAYGLGGLTWFWIFYRFYKDGDTLIFGHAPHFEHGDDDHH
jgi:hypothetical protein